MTDLTAGHTCVNQAIATYAFGTIARFTTTNPLDRPDWQARIDQQRLGRIRPSAPVLLYHGLQDEFIPLGQATRLKADWCRLGQQVSFNGYVGDHFSTFLTGRLTPRTFSPTASRADRPRRRADPVLWVAMVIGRVAACATTAGSPAGAEGRPDRGVQPARLWPGLGL